MGLRETRSRNLRGGLENFEPLDFDGFNIDWGIEQIEDEAVDDNFDFDNSIPTNPKAKIGDIYKLGEHILMCGDSTNVLDVEQLMGEENADLIVTDPPYNVNVEGSDGKTIENDNLPKEVFKEIIQKAFENMYRFTRLGGAIYCFHGDNEGITFRTAFESSGFKLSECLIWVKNGLVLSRQDYHWRHEPILYGWKEGFAHYFIDDRTQDTVLEDKLDVDKLSKQELKNIIKKLMNDKVATTIIREDKPLKNAEHPTMKPIPLIGRLVKNSSRPKEIVLDLFGGSGSTLITCEQLNRKCRMMELDPRYVDAIILRWETLTGNKAELLNERVN